MRIEDKQFNHGAALMQIAEHESFTAINPLVIDGEKSHTAFVINHDIAIYPKYATKPKRPFDEYLFNFSSDNVAELEAIGDKYARTCIPLICVKDHHICGLTLDDFHDLRNRRIKAAGYEEDVVSILVTIPDGGACRVYVNKPGVKKTILGKEILIPRNAFPNFLFEASFSARRKRKTAKV
ncbi:hypothetical protein [Rubinisphaera italica]|uniref:Uncharacterized protein n=1 Tax=Rubinisphaera italica TaxID=2527969 RepID=A0A5C5XMH5_9PLAN|nr:hypothetical protein [Rubinisphaera italica]TWT64406.1 hypothetical protein Pan54_51680 [Rubinisphaera italica]